MGIKLFVYQTLKDEKTIAEVLGHEKPEKPYTLKGYKKVAVTGRKGYDTLQPSDGDSVNGDIIECTKAEIKKIDEWEDEYERDSVGKIDNQLLFAYIYKQKEKSMTTPPVEKKTPGQIEHKVFKGEILDSDNKNLTIEHFISTETQDNVGDIMIADGMKQRGKVVVLFQHGLDAKYGNEPIAKPLSIRAGINKKGSRGLIAKTQYFDTSRLNPPENTGERLYLKAKEDYMPNWSIGFIVLKEHPVSGGRVVDEWELHEYSQVAVGMNAEATTEHALTFKVIEDEIKDNPKEPAHQEPHKCSHKSAHKAVKALHALMIEDLKEYATAQDYADSGAEKCAKTALNDFGDNAQGHIEKYIKAVQDMGGNDVFDTEDMENKGGPGSGNFGHEGRPGEAGGSGGGGEGDRAGTHNAHVGDHVAVAGDSDSGIESIVVRDSDGNEEEHQRNVVTVVKPKKSNGPLNLKGHITHKNKLHEAFGEMVKAIRAHKCNKDVKPEEEATKCIKAHAEAALPHAKEFVKAWAQKCSGKTVGLPERKSVLEQCGASICFQAMDTIHHGMISEMINKGWYEKELRPSIVVAEEISKEAGELHAPYIAWIIDDIRARRATMEGETVAPAAIAETKAYYEKFLNKNHQAENVSSGPAPTVIRLKTVEIPSNPPATSTGIRFKKPDPPPVVKTGIKLAPAHANPPPEKKGFAFTPDQLKTFAENARKSLADSFKHQIDKSLGKVA